MGAIVRFLITNKQLKSKFVLNNASVFYLCLFFRVNDVNLMKRYIEDADIINSSYFLDSFASNCMDLKNTSIK